MAVGLPNHALGDPHPVDPPDESSPFVEHLHLRSGQIHPEIVQRDERERLKPGLSAWIDERQSRSGSWPAAPSSLGLEQSIHIPEGRRTRAHGLVGDRHGVGWAHRPEAVGDRSLGCEQPKAVHLHHVIDDRVAVVENQVIDPTRPRLNCERGEMHRHVWVQQDRQSHRECGALVAEGMTRVSQKCRPTSRKVLSLKNLPPLDLDLRTGVLLVDTPV